MFHKIRVNRDSSLSLFEMHPTGFKVDNAVTLLQEDDVRRNFRDGVGFERPIRLFGNRITPKRLTLCAIYFRTEGF